MLGDVRPILLVLLSGAGVLLLIACINVVTLLLVRSDSRAREIVLRNALGVSWVRLALQFATEALVLVAAAGVLGLVLAAAGMRFLTSLLSADMVARLPSLQGIGLNLRLVAFAIAVSLVAAAVFALTPVLRTSISERFAGLKDGSRGTGTTWRRVGAYLVIAELAFAVILLVNAALLGKSLYRLLRVDTGLNPDHLATLSVRQPPGNLRKDQSLVFTRQVAARVAAVPGVDAVGYADQLALATPDAPTCTSCGAGFLPAVRASRRPCACRSQLTERADHVPHARHREPRASARPFHLRSDDDGGPHESLAIDACSPLVGMDRRRVRGNGFPHERRRPLWRRRLFSGSTEPGDRRAHGPRRASRTSSIFLGRIVGVLFMRVNSRNGRSSKSGSTRRGFSSPTCVRYDFRRSSVSFEHTDTAREVD